MSILSKVKQHLIKPKTGRKILGVAILISILYSASPLLDNTNSLNSDNKLNSNLSELIDKSGISTNNDLNNQSILSLILNSNNNEIKTYFQNYNTNKEQMLSIISKNKDLNNLLVDFEVNESENFNQILLDLKDLSQDLKSNTIDILNEGGYMVNNSQTYTSSLDKIYEFSNKTFHFLNELQNHNPNLNNDNLKIISDIENTLDFLYQKTKNQNTNDKILDHTNTFSLLKS